MNVDATTAITNADPRKRNMMLRQMVDEAVGAIFFEPMLKSAHNSAIKGKYGHGGRGEDIFQGQLDGHLASTMGRGIKTSLGDALYRSLTRQ